MEDAVDVEDDVSAAERSRSSVSPDSPAMYTADKEDQLRIRRIQELYPKLTLKILPQCIATRMFQHKALPPDVLETVQSTGNYNRGAEIILNYVTKSGPIPAACFMDALKETKQDDVINMLTGNDVKTSHGDRLQRHYEFLLDRIDISSPSLLNKLRDYQVLDKYDMDDIRAERTDRKQIAKLLNILPRKSTRHFRSFLRALNETGQQFIEDKLKNEAQGGGDTLEAKAVCASSLRNVSEKELREKSLEAKANHMIDEIPVCVSAIHVTAYKSQNVRWRLDIDTRRAFDGVTPLHLAANGGHTDAVQWLLARNADINARTTTVGATPLHWVAERGYTVIMQLLLDTNADINARRAFDGVTPLHLAANRGHTDTVQWLLNRNADINARTTTDGATPLHWVAERGYTDIMQLLLDTNARRASDGVTQLH